MRSLLLVAVGGGLGAVARYALSGWVLHQTTGWRFPAGTFAVNVLGCLVAGLLTGLAAKSEMMGPATRVFLFTGVLGGFTTFSAFGLETMLLLRRGDTGVAAANVALSVVVGVGALWLGWASWAPRR